MDPSVNGNLHVRVARFEPQPSTHITVSPVLVPNEDIYHADPSAEDSEGTKEEKRIRRERIAENYIQYGYIGMLTASLRGPTTPKWSNPWEASKKRKKEKPPEKVDLKAEGRKAFERARDSAVQQPERPDSPRPDNSSTSGSNIISRDLLQAHVIDLTDELVEVPEHSREPASLAAQPADLANAQNAGKHHYLGSSGSHPSTFDASRKATKKTSASIESRLSAVEAYSSYVTKQPHIKREFTEGEEEPEVMQQPKARKSRVRHHKRSRSKKATDEEQLLNSSDDASDDQAGSKSTQAMQQFRLQQIRKYAKLAQAAKAGAHKRRAEWDDHEDDYKRMKISSKEESSAHTSIGKIKVEPEQSLQPQSPILNAVKHSTPEKRAAAKRYAEQDGYGSPNKKRRISETSLNSASSPTSRTATPPIKAENLQASQAKLEESIDSALSGDIDFVQSASGSEVAGEKSENIEEESDESMDSDDSWFRHGVSEAYDKTPVTHKLSPEVLEEARIRRIAAEERHAKWVEGIKNGTIKFTNEVEPAAQKPIDKLPSFSQGQLLTESTPLMYSTSKESENVNTSLQGDLVSASANVIGSSDAANHTPSEEFINPSHLLPIKQESLSEGNGEIDFSLFEDLGGEGGAENGSKQNAQHDPYGMDTQAIADAVDEAGSFLNTWNVSQDAASM